MKRTKRRCAGGLAQWDRCRSVNRRVPTTDCGSNNASDQEIVLTRGASPFAGAKLFSLPKCFASRSKRLPVLRQIVVADRSPRGAVEIVELAAAERQGQPLQDCGQNPISMAGFGLRAEVLRSTPSAGFGRKAEVPHARRNSFSLGAAIFVSKRSYRRGGGDRQPVYALRPAVALALGGACA